MSKRLPSFALATLLPPVLVLSACEKRDPPRAEPAAAAASEPKAPPAAVRIDPPDPSAWHYAVDATGSAQVDMPGIAEDIRGEATAARGSLDIVAGDLVRSRGQIAFDLSTFATHTFHSDKDATQTTHALTWLEVKVGDKQNEEMRWATLSIRSIEAPSAASVSAAPSAKEGGDDVRTVTMKIHGDLRLHGRTLPEDALVDIVFRYPPGNVAGSPPPRVEVRSRAPMRVTLKDYDVRPRDPAGQIVAWTTQLVSKVAETADVTVNLGASLAPR
jgi:hypothetical protein